VIPLTDARSFRTTKQSRGGQGSSRPRQVVLGGGHEIYEDDPVGVLAEVGKVLESIRSGG
jgi:hypothetical protein